jgi:hypothetical protein
MTLAATLTREAAGTDNKRSEAILLLPLIIIDIYYKAADTID